MKTIASDDNMYQTDILVVGYGSAGLAAALAAKDAHPRLAVLAADKACPGFGGKANKGGGHCAFIPEGGEEAYVEYQVRNLGDYLSEQHLLRDYANATRQVINRMMTYGVQFYGQKKPFSGHPVIPWKVMTVDLDFMQRLARRAKAAGVKFLEKVSIVDLLTNGNRVVGAIGFSLLTGETILIRAKAVILANGNQNWRIMRMWASGRGDGIAAAYRAGAKMRNAEFGSFVGMTSVDHGHMAYGAEDALYNARGESISEFARPFLKDNPNLGTLGGIDLGGNHALLMHWEVKKGNGPIYQNSRENGFVVSPAGRNLAPEVGQADPGWYRPVAHKFWHGLYQKKIQGYRDNQVMKEIVPGFIGECSPVYVGRDMATSMKGLYAAGDICACGNAATGAVPSPPGRNRGTGLMWSWFMGLRAGESAADFAAATSRHCAVDYNQASALKARFMAPLVRTDGITVDEILKPLQHIMSAIDLSAWKHESRMNRALAEVLALKEKLPEMKVEDAHYLSAANEVTSMVLCSEMFFRAALARKESRGWFIREDYPDRDDQAFCQWVVLQHRSGEMSVSFEQLPLHEYRYHPGDRTIKSSPMLSG
ncbi:Succinate dehydrogenase flavoprotein subunit [Vibrio aerogenes CECT 7868]|uniref:Succinate dehydrogenase flavoprotein subunit n=1 Tax=Vibrio aerogenes CECT 7868 TaxID=1216006 RepID=A0A1M5Y3V5_9VIBR|nr:FAD-binding protein [Vibrio aerogenes]SHI06488.1 Succinate dehydrogenase flavoprotein subunit [Vibrio aerogenes CECT 7868]